MRASLIAKGLDNCLMAGRCFSADRLALSSARVMPTACLMGQAAGIAAALAVERGTALRHVPPSAIRGTLVADRPPTRSHPQEAVQLR
jgi:hypothetical protein